jgi:5-methylcytosine-specific restriction endonuclease McrA
LILIDAACADAIRRNNLLFEYITLLGCAKFLEEYNTCPRLISKIPLIIYREQFTAQIRHSFDMYLKLMHADRCFYCMRELKDHHKDHFIPWEYVLEHKIWNLVPSCPKCNNGPSGKFIKIPEEKYLDKIIERNKSLYSIKDFNLDKEFTSAANMEEAMRFLYTNALNSGYTIWKK